jgi:hypothetical protein
MFYPVLRIRDVYHGSGSKHFLIPDPGAKKFFHPGSYMKSGMQSYFFLASCGIRSKVLPVLLVIVKKIQDPDTQFFLIKFLMVLKRIRNLYWLDVL